VRDSLAAILREDGHAVETASGGIEALRRLRERPLPTLILLDLMMPEMDGFEFMQELRRKPECSHIPVIVVTAKDLSDEERRRLNGHVIQIIAKGGHTTRELLDEIEKLISNVGEAAKSI
jgi:CheY-like chemotaxis protein